MNDKYGVEQDPYCYPGTSTLKNLLNIRDETILEVVEREITELEAQRQIMSPPPYDYSYLMLIHKAMFSDISYNKLDSRHTNFGVFAVS